MGYGMYVVDCGVGSFDVFVAVGAGPAVSVEDALALLLPCLAACGVLTQGRFPIGVVCMWAPHRHSSAGALSPQLWPIRGCSWRALRSALCLAMLLCDC